MDRKSVLILIVCAVLFLVWAQVTPRLYPPPKPVARPTNALSGASNSFPSGTTSSAQIEAPRATAFIPPKPGAPEELLVVTNENARYTFTSHGGGLKTVELLKYPESVTRGSKGAFGSNRVVTLNAQAQQPVLALIGSEALAGDGIYTLSRFSGQRPVAGKTNQFRNAEGVRAEDR